MDIKQIFESIDNQLLDEFRNKNSQINHHVKKGEARERELATFLSSYLPKKYAITSGEIVDIHRHISSQCDLIIYDQANCPLILYENGYSVFPCEPILGVIEVKSCLNKKNLVDCVEKTKKIKTLQRENGFICSIVFAYTASFGKNPILSITEEIREQNKNLNASEFIDMICILENGLITLTDNRGKKPSELVKENIRIQSIFDMVMPCSLYFFMYLLDLLASQKSIMPEYYKYIGGGEIGGVLFSESTK